VILLLGDAEWRSISLPYSLVHAGMAVAAFRRCKSNCCNKMRR